MVSKMARTGLKIPLVIQKESCPHHILPFSEIKPDQTKQSLWLGTLLLPSTSDSLGVDLKAIHLETKVHPLTLLILVPSS